jgi:hypothetical protein
MGLLNEALAFLGLTADSAGRYELTVPRTRAEQRELAEAMRRMPGRYAARLSARAASKITAAAAAGQWEKAIDQLITTLHARAEVITAAEREELCAVLKALNRPTECLDTLLVHPDRRAAKDGPVTTPVPRRGR